MVESAGRVSDAEYEQGLRIDAEGEKILYARLGEATIPVFV
jgi:hypothetical protein